MSLHISPGKYGDDEWIFFSVCGNETCKVLEQTLRFDLKSTALFILVDIETACGEWGP